MPKETLKGGVSGQTQPENNFLSKKILYYGWFQVAPGSL